MASMDPDVRRRYALSLLSQGADSSPVKHPLAAVARALQGAMGGYVNYRAGEDDKEAGAQMFASLPGLSSGAAPEMPSAPQGQPAMQPDMSQPRGIRNNNPLNIEAGNFTQGQPGFAGSDGRFAKFASMDQGVGAANKLLDVYQNKHGLNTVAGIVGRWAPSSDGNNVSSYAANVSKQLGIDPNAPIPPEMRQQLIAAMGQHENGRPVPMGQPQQMAQAQPTAQMPARQQTQIPPDVAQTIRQLGADPRTRSQAWQLYLQYAKPVDTLDQEAKRLDIEAKKKGLQAAPTTKVVKQADGSEVALQWDTKSESWLPLKAPEGGNPVANPKLTEQQSKDVGFYNRGEKILPRLEQQDKDLTDVLSAVGGSVTNYAKSDKYRQAEQTGRELLAVILRKDTGAAVTPSEFQMYGDIYLPKPGDDQATIEQKRVARKTAIEGLRMGLGTADIIFKSREAMEAAKGTPTQAAPAAPAKQAPKAGETMDGYRFKGGDPSKRENWEQVI
jgi:hypothetical protein